MRRILTTLAVLALGTASTAQAAVSIAYFQLAAWQAAVGAPVLSQDFSGYADGTDLTGVNVLPGVTLTSNLGPVEVFGGGKSAVAFGPRGNGNAYYEAQFAQPFMAVAMDIIAFESIPGDGTTAVDQGVLSFLFSDGSSRDLVVSGGDGSPIFIGMLANMSIVSFRWTEAHEASGGNEESGLDNLRVAKRAPNELPLPGSLPLALAALAAVPLVRRRR